VSATTSGSLLMKKTREESAETPEKSLGDELADDPPISKAMSLREDEAKPQDNVTKLKRPATRKSPDSR
jgi:Asp-tRNA(Asn)/Glu-tRNA(Gln) amidotransferase C subunit